MVTGLLFGFLLVIAIWSQSRMGGQLLPHAFCLSASQPLLRLHLISGALVAVAYLLIPLAMLNFVRKRKDVPFGWVAWVFGAFILACGVTHALDIWTLYYPVYWYAGVAKAFTAVISLGTAWLVWKLTPLALQLPSAAQLRESNAALEAEIVLRRKTEAELSDAKHQLERLLREVSIEARQSAAILDRFFDAAPVGLALVDSELRMIRSNRKLPELTGRPAAEYAGSPVISDLERLPAPVLEAIVDVRDTGSTCVGIEVPRADEKSAVLKCDMFPIETEDGPRLVGIVVEDVTAERDLERERSAALAEAKQADRRKTEFLAVLSHELRNPLAPVRQATAVLKRGARAKQEIAERMVSIIERQVTHMTRLIEDLLDISRIERGKIRHQPVDTDLAQITRQVCSDYEASFEAAGIVLQVEIGDAALPVAGDPVRLAQAVGNYLHNAAKFAPHGTVVVRAYADRASSEAVVRVTDDGEGIAPELLSTLFTPFVQGEGGGGKKGGLGLGLSLARYLAEMHGGCVTASSDGLGKGASFELRIPLGQSPAAGRSAGPELNG